MSRKTSDSHHGLNDVIGFALLAAAVLLLVAQLSFDRYDLSFVSTSNPPHHQTHNWAGPLGADAAYAFFFVFGLAAYVLPFLLAAFGIGFITSFFSHLRERRLWLGLWSAVLVFSLAGLLDMMDGPLKTLRENIDAPGAGGWLGLTLFDFKFFGYDWGFWMLGAVGATIVYLALCFISLLFLTNFRLGGWVRALLQNEKVAAGEPEPSGDNTALDRRARELERQAKQLQEQVTRSGLGADMQPVPEPTVRDLSVPQGKARYRKTTLPEPHKESEAAPAAETKAVTAEEAKSAAPREVRRQHRRHSRQKTGGRKTG